jgi:hypothetical protein
MSRFAATADTILSHLCSTMVKMRQDASGWGIRFGDRVTKKLARDLTLIGVTVRADDLGLYPNGVRITFERKGIPYAFQCAKYDSTRDNFRATQQAISWSWRIFEDYGVTSGGHDDEESFARIFGGHRADRPALPPSWTNWWEVIGVPGDAPLEVVTAAYRRQIRLVHPDNRDTGNEYLTRALNAAYDAARKELGG